MSVKNPQVANESLEAMQDKHSRDAEEHAESMSTADKILKARQQKTVTLDLEGLDVDFQTMLGDVRDEVDDIEQEVQDLAAKAERAEEDDNPEDVIGMSEEEAVEKVEAYRDRFIDILVEHATDDSLTRDFWLEAYGRNSAGQIAMRLKEQSEKADMTEDELRNFHRE